MGVKPKKTATPDMAALGSFIEEVKDAGDHVDTGIQVFVGGTVFLQANFCEPLRSSSFPEFWVEAHRAKGSACAVAGCA